MASAVRIRRLRTAIYQDNLVDVFTDTQGKRQHRDGGKSRAFAQLPQRVTKVLDCAVRYHPLLVIFHLILRSLLLIPRAVLLSHPGVSRAMPVSILQP